MARRRGLILGAAGVVLLGAVGYTALSGGSSTLTADPGGGTPAPSSPPPAPYAIHTLGSIGTAAQDPGGGGGGTGPPGNVGPPAIQGARGPGSAQGFQDSGDILYLSGINTLDPNRSAVTSGQNQFGGPGVGSLTGALGGGSSAQGSTTGCASPPQETDYYGIPLRNVVTYSGNPRVHLNITGGGTVTALLYQQTRSQQCQLIGQGTAAIHGGVADVTIGSSGHRYPVGVNPALVIRANDGQSHTISTSSGNPSYLELPNLTGV